MREFDFEKLDAFRLSLDFAEIADRVADELPPKRAYLADQLRRSASSIVLNVAEGAGEWLRREKKRFYRYAKRSATESAAAVALIDRLKLCKSCLTAPARETIWRLMCTLVGLAKMKDVRRAG